MKLDIYSRKICTKIYAKEVKSSVNSVSYIFLYTKIIYESLSAERIILYRKRSISSLKNEN